MINKLTFTRYTKEAWLRCYPESNENEWEEVQQPYSVSDFLKKQFEILEYKGFCTDHIEEIHIITLDEEYFDWLEKEGLENTEDSRKLYRVPEKDSDRLMRKHRMDRDYKVMFLPVSTFLKGNVKEYVLSQNTAGKIREYLRNVYGKGNVWFPGYVLNCQNLLFDISKFQRIGVTCMEEKKKISLGEYESAEVKNAASENWDETFINPTLTLLPFLVKGTFDRSVIRLNEKEEEAVEADFPEDHDFDFEGFGVEKMLRKDFHAHDVYAYNNCVSVFEIEDLINEWQEMIFQILSEEEPDS